MHNVVIGGGTGFIGQSLVAKLKASNFSVRLVTRYPKNQSDISWNSVKAFGLPDDTDVVLNLSGRSIVEINPLYLFKRCYQAYIKEVYSSRVETTKLLASCLPKKTKKFITSSAIGIYKPDLNLTYTESFDTPNVNLLTDLVREWEAAGSISKNNPDTTSAQVRIGIVLGKGAPFLQSLYPTHRLGLGGPIGSGAQWLSWIHITDLVNLFFFLIDSVSISGPVNGTAPHPVRQLAFSRAFGESIGAPFVGRVPTPGWFIGALFGRERSTLVLDGQRVLPDRALTLGFKFTHPILESALKDIYGRLPSTVSTD